MSPPRRAWRVDEDVVVSQHVRAVWRKSVWPMDILSLRSWLTHVLGGPCTCTARSIKGGEGEVTLHQMACRFSPHIACLLTGRHQRSREPETRRQSENLL